MNENYSTIWEDFELPSKGLIYDKTINPKVSLRSMTTLEEMKRLSPTDNPYKVMSDIIEDCMKDKPNLHVYDLSIGDYQYLLHKLRVVSYGNEYKMVITCPNCGESHEVTINLDDLNIQEWTEEVAKFQLITLPVSNHTIELRFESPKDIDLINYRNKEIRKKLKTNLDYTIVYTLCAMIKKVDGRVVDDLAKEEFVKSLPIKDTNYILSKATDLGKMIGIDTDVSVTCPQCGFKFITPFRITSEFFGPRAD